MVDTLRLSEHFVSPQGEGPRTGVLTQFVRFAGCNMRCPGWPCDTPYAIDPAIWRHDSYKMTPSSLVQAVVDKSISTGAKNINLTGGEPFQQPHHLLEQFIARLPNDIDVECFSNGSFIFPNWAINRIEFVMDWKLEGSGEAQTEVGNRLVNARRLKNTDAIKFVCVAETDMKEAERVWHMLCQHDVVAEFWIGAAWNRMFAADIVEFVKEHKLPWRLNVQVHNYIYPAQERGR